jgi:hypothetical protein
MRVDESKTEKQDPGVYARTAAPMARTRPPKETMLRPAAPVDSEGLPVVVELALGEEGDLEAPVPAAGTVELAPGAMGVTGLGTGATGVAVGTAGVTAGALTGGTTAGTDGTTDGTTAGTEGRTEGTTEGTAVAGGAWI